MPSKTPIKTGLCAYGMSGRVFHAPFIASLSEFELTAVVERHHKKAQERYPQIHSYTSVEALLADESIELVIVNTPNAYHKPHVKQALKAGKHVIVEKPFALTLKEGKELMALAKQKKRVLAVYQNRRWDSDFLVVRQVVTQQRLGRLVEAEFHYDRYRQGFSSKKHKEEPGPGSGILYDLGPHLIDQALCLFGKPQAVFGRLLAQRPQSKVDDYFVLQLLYPRFTCTLKASQLVREPLPAYVLHGVKGSFLKQRADVQERDLDAGKSPLDPDWGVEEKTMTGWLHTEENGKVIQTSVSSPVGDYSAFYRGVYASIREAAPTPIRSKEALATLAIIEAAIQSDANRQVVVLGD